MGFLCLFQNLSFRFVIECILIYFDLMALIQVSWVLFENKVLGYNGISIT